MNLIVASAIVFGAATIACLVLLAVHRLGKRDVFVADPGRAGAVYGIAATGFAVMLAFVIVVAFQEYNEARVASRAEADAVLELSRSAEFFPSADRREMQGGLVCYGRAVVEQEWPAMGEGDGERNPVVDAWGERLHDMYRRLPVPDLRAQAAFENLLVQRDARISARRDRLAQARPTVPSPVWFFLILGAVLNIGFVLMFIDRRNESFAAQASLLAAVATIVVAGLVLVWFLDHPYEDESGSVKPLQMRGVVQMMLDEQPSLAIPCTAEGDPIPA